MVNTESDKDITELEFFGKYNSRWIRFTDSMYFKGMNQMDAYLDAFDTKNKNSAKSSASRLIKSDKYQQFLSEYSDYLTTQVENKKGLDITLSLETIRNLSLNAETEKVKLEASKLLLNFWGKAQDVNNTLVLTDYTFELGESNNNNKVKEVTGDFPEEELNEGIIEGEYE